ncbi:UNVERIFIED_CONTAM: RNA polymerase II subunit A C-terminal domain phosphatase SSU72 [Sesamum angustifolium]|uniref:RNA polymerase II subunit A C-terminal domain phosphatase SSU72 n=1 Tax=Sesamum angustifolium TaxID=2727405 RepID=A0AAW2RJL0_9LAMI
MKLRYAMVCSSNQNRSMEAHALLKREGLDVASYGTGQHVKLPGPSLREPNVYEFGTPYKHMLDDLRRKDPELSSISASQVAIQVSAKWNTTNAQEECICENCSSALARNAADGTFDVVLTFEEKVFDMVIEDLHNRNHVLLKPVLVINLEVKDNHEEAAIGGRLALQLCQEFETIENWEDCVDDVIINFERQNNRKLLYSISYY